MGEAFLRAIYVCRSMPWRSVSMGVHLMGVNLIGMNLIGVDITGMYLTGVYGPASWACIS
jgi:uncharacterized membrane protein